MEMIGSPCSTSGKEAAQLFADKEQTRSIPIINKAYF